MESQCDPYSYHFKLVFDDLCCEQILGELYFDLPTFHGHIRLDRGTHIEELVCACVCVCVCVCVFDSLEPLPSYLRGIIT